jgi:hypothetical protein
MIPELEWQGSMMEEGKAKFHYVPMFSLNRSILMVSVRASYPMKNTLLLKKGRKRPKFSTKVSLHTFERNIKLLLCHHLE